MRPLKKTDANRPWAVRAAGSKRYGDEEATVDKKFLIVCEGKNTEVEYFKSFDVVGAEVKPVGAGRSKTALVEYAIRMRDEEGYGDYEIWCVFDYDVKPDEGATQPADYDGAIALAAVEGMNCAVSNDAFELWFILHYGYLDTAVTRQQYYRTLREQWDLARSYATEGKKRAFCAGLYERLRRDEAASQEQAILHAKRLEKMHMGKSPSGSCPHTTVHHLVRELNNYLRK